MFSYIFKYFSMSGWNLLQHYQTICIIRRVLCTQCVMYSSMQLASYCVEEGNYLITAGGEKYASRRKTKYFVCTSLLSQKGTTEKTFSVLLSCEQCLFMKSYFIKWYLLYIVISSQASIHNGSLLH
jgi:hypothetical protein